MYVSSTTYPQTEFTLNKSGYNLTTDFKPFKQYLPKPQLFILFRLFLLFFGRIKNTSQFIRKVLQSKLIYNQGESQFKMQRNVVFKENKLVIKTIINGPLGDLDKAYRTDELVPIYTAVSECFQESTLNHTWKSFALINGQLILEEIIV